MAGIGIRKMNWSRTVTAHESMSAWRAKNQAYQQKYEAQLNNMVSALQTAWTDSGLNLGQIAANRAMSRMQAEAKASQEKAAAAEAAAAFTVNAPKRSAFSYSDSITITGGATIDLSTNTMTRSDGTQVDLTTGLKINVTA